MPVLLWATHFTIAYGFTAFACARHMSAAVPWVVGAVSVAALVALAALAVRAARTASFLDFLALGLAGLAAIAVVWEASSLVWVPVCA
jgi:hypothetical protein